MVCEIPEDHVMDASDCDDGSDVAYPGATEVCDGEDNDCDGEVDGDLSVDRLSFYVDADGDGFGDSGTEVVACDAPADHVADGTDCDDTKVAVNPDAAEVCNGIDDNCDAEIDEEASSICPDEHVCHGGVCRAPCESGQWDDYFGEDGRIVIDEGSDEWLEALDVDADGRVVGAFTKGSAQFEVFRVAEDGTLDSGFGSGGRVSTAVGPSGSSTAIAVDSEGRVVVGGRTSLSCSHDDNRYVLTRYLDDGSLDPSFGSGGITTTDFDSVSSSVQDLAFQSDGKIVISGHRYQGGCSPGTSASTITRYSADGLLDTSFGSGPFAGETRLDIPHGPHHDSNGAVAIGPDDRIYTLGRDGYGSWVGIQYYDAVGHFSSRQYVAAGYPGRIMMDDTDGSLLLSTDTILARLSTSGEHDSTFGGGGIVSGSFRSTPDNMVIDSEGRIYILIETDVRFEVARFLANGTLDTSFGEGGYSRLELGTPFHRGTAIALQPGEGVVVGGIFESPEGRDLMLARICF